MERGDVCSTVVAAGNRSPTKPIVTGFVVRGYMSTQDQTFIIDGQFWSGLSSDPTTTLFLYGTELVPVDLNDRIRPVTTDTTLLSSNGDENQLYDIVVRIDEADFMSDTGPGRFANAAYVEFVD